MLNKKAIAATAAGVETDEDFNQTVLLLHGDGTNGAQNNTFTDSSTNNFTITRNGNTTQGTFSPFSVGASEWSNYFDNVGDYLSIANNSALQISSSDMTIEAWVYSDGSQEGDDRIIGKSSGYSEFSLFWQSATQIRFVATTDGASWTVDMTANSVPANQWVHVAVTRSGSNWTIWINGVSSATDTQSGTVTTNTAALVIGGDSASNNFKGYISNARLVKGTAVYTASFTPPTSPLTAITNTSLLTCQSNRFKDNSTNNFTITVNGNPSVQAFSPFNPTAAYSAATNGGSGYFDGSGDYLSLASDSAWALGTGDFTVSCWVYFNDHSRQQIVGNLTTSSNTTWALYIQDGGLAFSNWSFSPVTTYDANAFAMKQWNWIEVSRVSGTYYLFINGVEIDNGTASPAQDYSSTTGIIIGDDVNWSGAGPLNGYLCDLRIVKGSGITSSTVPTSPISAITNTQLLCKFQNAGIIDSTAKNVLETVGNAQIDTGTKKFGTGSLEFDGTGDWLVGYQNVLYNMGNGDFTVEFWAKTTTTSSGSCFVGATSGGGPANTQWGIFQGYASSTSIDIYLSDGSSYFAYTGGGNVTDGNWHHVAFARSGSSGKLFLDGTQVGSTLSLSTTSLAPSNKPIYIGSQGGDYPFNGFLDDLRITKGVARYTANFTAPTKAFPDQ